ncbi:MAG TPA: dTDP-4-dehydrorhamnose 3,5-epimerase family protein [bacterium]|nr:dTDP-4-dehydrorhamnose 3,5-epimerase family protein [bacterium]HOM26930.1 dTDP-4-dehydrorhamnose 3,5-epimerase family protein [bacterium]
MIDGVKIKVLKIIPDERGRLMEILRRDDDIFTEFGQVYITTAYPGVVKAWHAHRFQDDNITVIKGMAKIVLCDLREGSSTYKKINEFFVGDYNPVLIHIPKLIWHGFKCISENECIVLNIPTNVYNYEKPDELRLPYNTPEIPYDWERRNY